MRRHPTPLLDTGAENLTRLAREHVKVSRRFFLQLAAAGTAGLGASRLLAGGDDAEKLLAEAIAALEPGSDQCKIRREQFGTPQ